MYDLNPTVAKRKFHIWRLELWWSFFDQTHWVTDDGDRVHLIGNWYWRIK